MDEKECKLTIEERIRSLKSLDEIIFEETHRSKYWEKLNRKSSEFYRDKMHSIDAMKGKVRDVDYSDHLMWKLEPTLRSVTNPLIQYEFLIEYKISDPVTGIYFGCKAIADYDVTIEQLIEISDREWADVKKGVLCIAVFFLLLGVIICEFVKWYFTGNIPIIKII